MFRTKQGSQELENVYNIALLIKDLHRKIQLYDMWLAALIINSSKSDLENRLKNKVLALEGSEQGGPIIFKLMMEIVFSVTDQALCLLISRIEQMKVTEYVGEDISRITSF
eukprot:13612604-Ditylum_brightwellii.AAC.1